MPKDKPVYVWRLHVTLPEESAQLGWEPPGWAEEWGGSYDDEPREFHWPSRRHYLSHRGASLRIVPVTFETACQFVAMWHRHHQPPPGCKFCQGLADEADVLRGVAITGRPVARMFDNGLTLEVTRSATDGTPNANSKLYAAAWQEAAA